MKNIPNMSTIDVSQVRVDSFGISIVTNTGNSSNLFFSVFLIEIAIVRFRMIHCSNMNMQRQSISDICYSS